MRILKDKGSFLILTPKTELRKSLLRIEKAGRTAYQSETRQITKETAERFVRMILKLGHESVIEHSNMTVRFSNISRGFTHQLVRHRLCAFTQESTRYVDYVGEISCIVPPQRDENKKIEFEDGRKLSLSEMFKEYEKFYRALRKAGWSPEDARQVLPIGVKSQIVVSANFRQWRHIFEMRTAKTAHWEIRKVMGDLLVKVKTIIPVIFEDFIEAGKDKNGLRYFIKKH